MTAPAAPTLAASAIRCGGCGAEIPPDEPYPFRCPNAGDGGDHVLRRVLEPSAVAFPTGDDEPNPFVRYRGLLHARHLAGAHGMDDQAFAALVRRLDEQVARVDGRGFRVTPFAPAIDLARRAGMDGELWVKDETGNVSGSHKARHLFGLLVHLQVVEALGLVDAADRPDLAIASCGNAALAAAVVAAAGGRRLRVFVPTDADPVVVERLRALGADLTVCPREPGVPGDPTYHRLRRALEAGALPFTCQGNENGLAIEGGETLGWEIAGALADRGAALDHLVVQVGGGALASAVAQALFEAVALGVLPRAPAIHTVQTEGAWPLRRAYDAVAEHLPTDAGRAGAGADPDGIREALRYAAAHRGEFMWPWESEPHSIAHGILDDETYDWLAVVEAMLTTGGRAVVVGERALAEANALAVDTTGIDVDPTGSAGLAGLLELRRLGIVEPGQRAAVLFTGVRR